MNAGGSGLRWGQRRLLRVQRGPWGSTEPTSSRGKKSLQGPSQHTSDFLAGFDNLAVELQDGQGRPARSGRRMEGLCAL